VPADNISWAGDPGQVGESLVRLSVRLAACVLA